MDTAVPNIEELYALEDYELWGELGKAVKTQGLGMLPEEEEQDPSDEQAGFWFYSRQFPNLKKIYCSPAVSNLVTDEKKRDVTIFVTSLIDLFSGYFGVVAGTILLVQIYKIGVDQFCKEDGPKSSS